VASETKKQAKKIPGNSLFVERREYGVMDGHGHPVPLAGNVV
jgi:hypothetical protein